MRPATPISIPIHAKVESVAVNPTPDVSRRNGPTNSTMYVTTIKRVLDRSALPPCQSRASSPLRRTTSSRSQATRRPPESQFVMQPPFVCVRQRCQSPSAATSTSNGDRCRPRPFDKPEPATEQSKGCHEPMMLRPTPQVEAGRRPCRRRVITVAHSSVMPPDRAGSRACRLSCLNGTLRLMVELPAGTVTFLFTDLEGSTRLGEEHPNAMPAALVRHDEIVRRAIEAHDGVVLSEMGDGMAAVFASPVGAVTASVDAQLALRDEVWGEVGVLRARMGLHAGEGTLRPDGQYVNAPLNRCARLMAVAHGGQVVCSDSVEVVVRDRLAPEVGVVDLGEHLLRDLALPVHVFQVTHPGLPSAFPPLRSLDAFRGNLPVQLTSFVGRTEELAGVAVALDERRLVTLTGTGGVGKTRLALQAAADVLPRFRDGAWFCELAAAADGESMAQLVAAELGVSQRPGMSLEASISDYLRPKVLLLV